MAVYIKVRYAIQGVRKELQSYDLQVTVLDATDMPKEIFVFQRRVPSATDPERKDVGDQFVSIADPVDLEEYPVGSPDLSNEMPYYRLAAVTLRFRDKQSRDDVKELIDADIVRLVDSLKSASATDVTEDKTYA